jgi:hypothetical protein
MNIDRSISSTQLVWAIGLVVGLAIALILGAAIGNQDFQRVAFIVGMSTGVGVMLALGKNYWMLIPFALGAYKLPAVPLGGRSLEFPELAIAACFLMFFLRLATRKEKLRFWQAANVPVLLFMAWVGMVFVLNPVGLAMIGSSTGGGRFYVKLVLAFAAYLILVSRTYTKRDIRWVLGFIMFGAIFSLVYGIVEVALIGPQIDVATGMIEEEFYTWHQELSVPGYTLAFLIFARYSPREVFGVQKLWLPIAYALCILMVLMSGKRLAMVAVFMPPLISAVVHKQYIYVLVASLLAAASLTLLAVGQGQWFNLPLVAQRTLSWLPGDWDSELEGMRGGTDAWRAELRYWAAQNIQKAPIIGEGFAVDLNETVAAIAMNERGGDLNMQVAAYALGRAWHNTWLGYAADFGIPLSVMQAIIYGMVLVLSFRCFKHYGNKSLFGVFALYLLIFTIRDVVASHTSGHSALDAWARWWMYGILVSIYLGMLKQRTQAPADATQAITHHSKVAEFEIVARVAASR